MNLESGTSFALSKPKILLMTSGYGLLLAGSIWLLQMNDSSIRAVKSIWSAPWFIHGLGGLGILLSGAIIVGLIRKLLDSSPGLVFDGRGLNDNSGLFSTRVIAWDDIAGFGVKRVNQRRFIYVQLKEPGKYLQNLGPFRRASAWLNSFWVPSPVVITTALLAGRFDDILNKAKSFLPESE